MSKELVVCKMKKSCGKKRPKYIPKSLPFDYRMLLIAPSGVGKTNLLCWLLSKKEVGWKKYYKKNIFVFSPTFYEDDTWDACKNIDRRKVFTSYDPEIIQQLKEEQKSIMAEGRKPPPLCVIFDDFASELKKMNGSNEITNLYFSGRHFNIDVIISLQSLKSCPKNIRLNATHIIIFGGINQEQLNDLAPEMPCSKEEFFSKHHNATKDKPYHFLYINNKQSVEKRFHKNFSPISL